MKSRKSSTRKRVQFPVPNSIVPLMDMGAKQLGISRAAFVRLAIEEKLRQIKRQEVGR